MRRERGSAGEEGRQKEAPAWETLSIEEALKRVSAGAKGLSGEEAARRLERDGPNALPRPEPTPIWRVALRQFMSPLIYVLLAAGLLALVLGEFLDAAFIGVVVGVNALIGTWMEARAEKGVVALRTMLKARASVTREGETRRIDAERLVVGDRVVLESGDKVPADLRLLKATGLQVDESLLTGESVAVGKRPDWVAEAPEGLGDRQNMVFAGTSVVQGRAAGTVVATGMATALGAIASDVLEAPVARPPLVARMDRFVRMITVVVVVLVVLTSGIGWLQGYALSEMFFLGVALAVAAIPEGLPVGLTVVLAIATTRMVRRHVVTRRLPVVEGLGSCTLIVSDKTGTLTVNALTVREFLLADGRRGSLSGQGFAPRGEVRLDGEVVQAGAEPALDELFKAALLNNEGELTAEPEEPARWSWHGDPTDVALLSAAQKLGLDRAEIRATEPVQAMIPFESARRYSASVHRSPEGAGLYVKGGPERVLAMCALKEGEREMRAEEAESLAARGYRVLGLARGALKRAPAAGEAPPEPEPGSLRFLGFVAMIDPLRAGARRAVEQAHGAGVEVFMVTGDHPVTALAICRELGIAETPDEVVAGPRVEEADEAQMERLVHERRVFARMAPHHKLKIVRAAQAAGHFVAVTGDGVNDAPALRAANIGVAMGKGGTDVARQAAGMVISDDNFASIVAGIEEGRVAYDTIRKVVFVLLSAGAAEIVLLALALAAGLPLPLLPLQILWLNVVTNGIQHLALAAEPAEGGELVRPPRDPDEPIFNRVMVERIVLTALMVGGIGVGLFAWLLQAGVSEVAARNAVLLFMVLFENAHVGNARSERSSILARSPLRSPLLIAAVLATQLLHVGAMYFEPTQRILEVSPLSWRMWLLLLALVLPLVVAIEIHKWWWRRPGRGQKKSAPRRGRGFREVPT
ncbi:ATPase [Lujinxingia litoralis]|uniref:ATPase n=1 Tax=Lujinxingia litoralis TaxID=2211119 RepID=A0A328CAR0_9DELT|nr:HAD-IC family P-type ATPase [Lujinxingia litoralis]RAL25078.1 ATPase [Lujinxingia litoralis]